MLCQAETICARVESCETSRAARQLVRVITVVVASSAVAAAGPLFASELASRIASLRATTASPMLAPRHACDLLFDRTGLVNRRHIDALLECLHSEDQFVRATAACALGRIPDVKDEVLTRLRQLGVSDPSDLVRFYSVNSLQELAPDDPLSVRLLLGLLASDNRWFVQQAKLFTQRCRSLNANILPVLKESCLSPHPDVRHATSRMLPLLPKSQSMAAQELLCARVTDSDARVRRQACLSLGQLAGWTETSHSKAVAVLGDANPEVQAAAALAIACHAEVNSSSLEPLIGLLDNRNESTVLAACYALARRYPGHVSSEKALQQHAQSENDLIARWAKIACDVESAQYTEYVVSIEGVDWYVSRTLHSLVSCQCDINGNRYVLQVVEIPVANGTHKMNIKDAYCSGPAAETLKSHPERSIHLTEHGLVSVFDFTLLAVPQDFCVVWQSMENVESSVTLKFRISDLPRKLLPPSRGLWTVDQMGIDAYDAVEWYLDFDLHCKNCW